MKFMCLTGAVIDSDGFESDILEFIQTALFCDLGVETQAAQVSIAMVD
jgi:hypothetical protein